MSFEDSHECKSSEEMRSLIDKYNDENSSGDKKKGVIFGMDAKALFPSLRIDSCMRAVKDLIKNSDITEKNLNWWELQKYIAVFYDEETIEAEGLLSVIPKRAKKPRRPLTINCLSNDASKYDDEKWVRAPDTPTLEQKKSIFAMAVAYGCKMVITNHVYTVGDEFFLQSRGGPIGLELTGILARVVMMDWDRRYLKAVSDAGIVMMMLGWYVDDINQIVKCDDGTSPADLIARLLEIANSIEPGIEMEVDICDNHSDQKIPMLDMKCWIDEDGDALYQHFEKSVSTKLIISSRSAHSGNCKRSVHISELVRRMLNFSRKLNWDQFVVPVLNEYMVRMAKAGYHQEYRKNVLLNAFAVYDSKIKKHIDGECPLNRPPGYKKVERQKAKVQKKRNWSTKGGFIAPIIVPSTPDSELAKMLREVAEKESEAGIRFKVVEKGGMTIEKMLQNSNPTASGKCGKSNCIMDNQPGGGKQCHKSNVMYEWKCEQCESSYIGETSRNFYSRSLEHIEKSNTNSDDSFISNHQKECHDGGQPQFNVKVIKTFQDPLSRQVAEGVYIRRNPNNSLNTKLDFYQASTYRVRREVLHG